MTGTVGNRVGKRLAQPNRSTESLDRLARTDGRTYEAITDDELNSSPNVSRATGEAIPHPEVDRLRAALARARDTVAALHARTGFEALRQIETELTETLNGKATT